MVIPPPKKKIIKTKIFCFYLFFTILLHLWIVTPPHKITTITVESIQKVSQSWVEGALRDRFTIAHTIFTASTGCSQCPWFELDLQGVSPQPTQLQHSPQTWHTQKHFWGKSVSLYLIPCVSIKRRLRFVHLFAQCCFCYFNECYNNETCIRFSVFVCRSGCICVKTVTKTGFIWVFWT